jgi:hypothetical protein
MKNKFLLIVLLAFAALQACVKDEEKVFDASAAERTTGAVNTLRKTLVAVPNGWVVEYYPEADRSMGGYHFIWKFDANGTVVVAGEQATANYPAGDTVRSIYEVIANRGVVLSFNTYNEVFHYFSEPRGSTDVDGFAGDYEFVLRESTPQKIVLTGKKRGNRIEMMPYTEGNASTWKDYLAQFKVLDQKMASPRYAVNVNDTAAAGFDVVIRSDRTFRFNYKNPDNNKIVPYITTPTGIKTYEPLTVDGETAQYFTFNEATETLVSENPGSNLTIKLRWIPLNDIFTTTTIQWYFLASWDPPIQPNMCTSLATAINTAETSIGNAEGESILFMYIGKGHTSNYTGNSIYFGCSPNGSNYYSAIYAFNFVNVAGTDDQVQLEYTAPQGDGSYPAYLTAFTPVINLIKNNSPYQLTSKNAKNPTDLTFTSVAAPTFYFTVFL